MSGDCPFCSHNGEYDSGYTGGDMATELGTIAWKALKNPGQLFGSAFSKAPVGHKGRCPSCKSKVIECPHCGGIRPYDTSKIEHCCALCQKMYQN
jgi:hypothetical protein